MDSEFKRPPEAKASCTPTVPTCSRRRVIIDVTDYVAYMVKSDTVSGIQRVLSAIAEIENEPENVIFSIWFMGAFRVIPYAVGSRPIDAINSYVDWKRTLRTVRTRRSGWAQRLLMA